MLLSRKRHSLIQRCSFWRNLKSFEFLYLGTRSNTDVRAEILPFKLVQRQIEQLEAVLCHVWVALQETLKLFTK